MTRLLALAALFSGVALAAPMAVPLPTSPVPAGQTVFWTPLLSATWEELKNETGSLTAVDPPNPVIEGLENFRWNREATFPDGSWKTWSGPATREFLEKVNAEATALTGAGDDPFTLSVFDPEARSAFGILDHRIEFGREFHRARQVPLVFKSDGTESEVSFFGAKGYHPSVEVLLWAPQERSHAIRIASRNPADSLVLFLPAAPMDMQTACERIRGLFARTAANEDASFSRTLEARDEVRIPYLTFEAETNLASFFQGALKFEKLGLATVPEVRQAVRFKLDEKGASVRVKSVAGADPFGPPPTPPSPRHFIYDRPFFLFMWRKDAGWPYFAAWIATPDGIEPFQSEK